ncbi:MAG: glycosyltransferase [Gemmatimonadaceae bacterium]|nr:glycosyltransferase [Gemmatimonadaceae bacterium]
MKLLFVSVDFPIPADRGLRMRTLTQLRLLAGLEGLESITLLSLRNLDVPQAAIDTLHAELPCVRTEAPVFQPIHMRRHPETLPRLLALRFLRRVPYIVGKCDNAAMRALLVRHLRTGDYDVVYLGSLGMATYLADVRRHAPRARVVLEQHNVEWEIFDRLAESFGARMRSVVRWEARSVRAYEARILRRMDAVIAISQLDAQAFRSLAGVEAIVIPPFIEPRAPRTERVDTPSLVYVGVLGWQPNVQGLDWFCREVWPLVRAQVPDATLDIAGGGLPRDEHGAPVMPPHWRLPGIRALGFVEDLDTVYRTTIGLVAPVIGGSGVRMKLLEAFSAGMPTVTTTDGAAGLHVTDGTELLVADAPAAFAERVVRLLRDRDLRDRLRRSGHAYLTANHSAVVGRTRLAAALGLPAPSAEHVDPAVPAGH